MSNKTFHNTTMAVAARPRSKHLREAGGYYTAIVAGKNAGSNADQTVVGGGVNGLFEEILDANSTVVGIKALHDIHIVTVVADEAQGIDEETRNISEILRHFQLEVVDEGLETERTVLLCDISMASQYGVSAGGIGVGGSGGGSGNNTLAGLVDTTVTSPQEHQMLVYDATSHWVNVMPSLAMMKGDVAISGTPSNGQVLKYSSTLGKWTAANDAGGISSVSLSSGSQNGTLALTVDGTTTDNIAVTGLAALAYKSSLAFSDLSTHPDSLSGYGITDARFGTPGTDYVPITLGSTAKNVLTAHQSLSGYATETWVTNRGYATQTWVGQQGFLTSSSLNGYATQTWVSNNFLSSVPEATDRAYGGFKTGYSESGKNYAVKLSSGKAYVNVPWTDTVYTHPTNGADTTISAANKRVLSAITVDSYGHVTGISSKDLTTSDIPDLSGIYLLLSGGTLTGDLRLKNSGNYGMTLYFGNGSWAYITEDTDDHLKIYGDYGISLVTRSTSYPVEIGTSGIATPATVYGNLTTYGNMTIGASTGTSSCKTLTVYGRTSSSYPAVSIFGVANSSTNYQTDIYRDATYLQIGSSIFVNGNVIATGAVTAGAASDRRLKDDIKKININDASDILGQLRPVEYDWNDDAARLGRLFGHSRGFLADEYLKIIPGAGRKIWGEYDAIDYNQTIPYLVGGWQAHNIRFRILEGEIKILKDEIHQLKRR